MKCTVTFESDAATAEQPVFTLEKVKAKARSTIDEDSRKTRFLRMETFSSVVHVKRFLGVLKLELGQIYKAANQIVCLKEV
jgi:hypothetical protein